MRTRNTQKTLEQESEIVFLSEKYSTTLEVQTDFEDGLCSCLPSTWTGSHAYLAGNTQHSCGSTLCTFQAPNNALSGATKTFLPFLADTSWQAPGLEVNPCSQVLLQPWQLRSHSELPSRAALMPFQLLSSANTAACGWACKPLVQLIHLLTYCFQAENLVTNLFPLFSSHVCYRQFVAHLPSEHTNCSFPHLAFLLSVSLSALLFLDFWFTSSISSDVTPDTSKLDTYICTSSSPFVIKEDDNEWQLLLTWFPQLFPNSPFLMWLMCSVLSWSHPGVFQLLFLLSCKILFIVRVLYSEICMDLGGLGEKPADFQMTNDINQ